MNVAIRDQRLIFRTAVIVAITIIAVTQVRYASFSVPAVILPQVSDVRGMQLSGLAAQFGLPIATASNWESPELYMNLMRSPELLRPLVRKSYEIDHPAQGLLVKAPPRQPEGIIGLLNISTDNARLDTLEALRWLNRAIRVSVDRPTGLVTFRVRTTYPLLSVAIAQGILDQLQEYHIRARQTQASAERSFVAVRLDSARAELVGAETAFQTFLETNRTFASSPMLRVEHDRIQREVELRQRVVAFLAEALEQARLDEVRNTPVFSIIEAPIVPARADDRKLLLTLAMGLTAGLILGLTIALLKHTAHTPGFGSEAQREELRRHWSRARAYVVGLLRWRQPQ